MLTTLPKLQHLIKEGIENLDYGEQPAELYDPIRYIMSLGGKRLRPVLTMLAYLLYKDDVAESLDHALAVEMFHNFTLMHDDIMDQAPLRRGEATVHEKWNANTAILSGDVMLVRVYDQFLKSHTDKLAEVLERFNQCAAKVCEGQQLDMLFETRDDVTEADYIDMIRLKTAVLLGFSLELGALLAEAPENDLVALREFGTQMGIGFQLKDDYLDVFGDHEKFGKQVGGDILSNKKTFLLINALDQADSRQHAVLAKWLGAKKYREDEKIAAVTEVYNELEIGELTRNRVDEYFESAFRALKKVNAALNRRAILRQFAEKLMDRDH